MKNPLDSMYMSVVLQSYRWLASVRSLFIAAALCVAGQASAAASDLTAGGVPNDNDPWNLGPSGMAGWCYKDGYQTPNARQAKAAADSRQLILTPSQFSNLSVTP